MFNNISRFIDDMFIMNYSEFDKHIPDIYLTEIQLNTSHEELPSWI